MLVFVLFNVSRSWKRETAALQVGQCSQKLAVLLNFELKHGSLSETALHPRPPRFIQPSACWENCSRITHYDMLRTVCVRGHPREHQDVGFPSGIGVSVVSTLWLVLVSCLYIVTQSFVFLTRP